MNFKLLLLSFILVFVAFAASASNSKLRKLKVDGNKKYSGPTNITVNFTSGRSHNESISGKNKAKIDAKKDSKSSYISSFKITNNAISSNPIEWASTTTKKELKYKI
jgi:hypothetical protein